MLDKNRYEQRNADWIKLANPEVAYQELLLGARKGEDIGTLEEWVAYWSGEGEYPPLKHQASRRTLRGEEGKDAV